MARLGTNDSNYAMALDDLAVAADPLYGCEHFHVCPLSSKSGYLQISLGTEHYARSTQIVRRQFHCHLVTRKNTDIVHSHLSGYMAEYHMAIFQFHSKRRVRQILQNLALHLNNVVFCHSLCSLFWRFNGTENRP